MRPEALVPDTVAEILSPEFPGERLLVCFNPRLRQQRARKREDLLRATEATLAKIAAAARKHRPPATTLHLQFPKMSSMNLLTIEQLFR